MVEVGLISSLANRLDSSDSGISDGPDSASSLSPNWCPLFSPISSSSMPDFMDQSSCFREGHDRDGGSRPPSPDEVREVASQLAFDLVLYVTGRGDASRSSNRYSRTLQRLSDELSSKHEIVFASLTQKLNLTDSELDCQFLENVAERMFSDGQYNWGRIVTFYAFAGWLARHCVRNNMSPQWPGKIACKTGKYVAEKASAWIISHGGWDEMETFFQEPDNTESKIWKGLFYTVLGLGALATTMAVVR